MNSFKNMGDHKTYFDEINKIKIKNANCKILLNKFSSAIFIKIY